MPRRKPEVKGLYYIMHVNNLPSIAMNGILAHRRVLESKIPFTPIYDADIVSNREIKQVTGNKTLWDFANMYFQPRNPMLYRVLREKDKAELVGVDIPVAVYLPREHEISEESLSPDFLLKQRSAAQ